MRRDYRAHIGDNAKGRSVRFTYDEWNHVLICSWSWRSRLRMLAVIAALAMVSSFSYWKFTGFDPSGILAALRKDWFLISSLTIWVQLLLLILIHQLLFASQVRFDFRHQTLIRSVRHWAWTTRYETPLSDIASFEIQTLTRFYREHAPISEANSFEAYRLVAHLHAGGYIALMETTDRKTLEAIMQVIEQHDRPPSRLVNS